MTSDSFLSNIHNNSEYDFQIVAVSDIEATLESDLALKPGRSIIQMYCNPQGSVLVVVDDQHEVTAYDLKKDMNCVSLPSYNSAVTAIGIHPVTLDIVVVYSDMMIKEYSLTARRYTTFCRKFLHTSSPDLTKRNSVIRNVSFDSRNSNLILLHDDSSIIVLDKGKEAINEKQKQTKFKRFEPSENSNSSSCSGSVKVGASGSFSFVRRSNQVIHFSAVKDESVVSVELNPLQLLEKLPPTLKVKKYGGV